MDGAVGLVVAVLVKAVPVGGAHLRPVGDRLTRDDVAHGLDPVNEITIEWALQQREAGRVASVVAVSMGSGLADDALRRSLAMGCDDVVLVRDDRLVGAEVRTTAAVLAAVVARIGARLAVLGAESLDGSSGAVPAAVAASLGWPLLGFARAAELDADGLRSVRDVGGGDEVLHVHLPAVLSLVGGAEPRYPTVRALLSARQRPLAPLDLDELGIAAPGPAKEQAVALRSVPVAARRGQSVPTEEAPAVLLELLEAHGVLDG